jgi:hypothetical protein
MEKIIVSEEQAKIIDIEILSCSSKAFRVVNISKKVDLDLVTIAQIVEGAPYEVKRQLEIGDVVKNNSTGLVYFVYSKGEYFIGCTEMEGDHGQRVYSILAKNLTLISKKENREDLKGELNV